MHPYAIVAHPGYFAERIEEGSCAPPAPYPDRIGTHVQRHPLKTAPIKMGAGDTHTSHPASQQIPEFHPDIKCPRGHGTIHIPRITIDAFIKIILV